LPDKHSKIFYQTIVVNIDADGRLTAKAAIVEKKDDKK
jgi:hypothetical protein